MKRRLIAGAITVAMVLGIITVPSQMTKAQDGGYTYEYSEVPEGTEDVEMIANPDEKAYVPDKLMPEEIDAKHSNDVNENISNSGQTTDYDGDINELSTAIDIKEEKQEIYGAGSTIKLTEDVFPDVCFRTAVGEAAGVGNGGSFNTATITTLDLEGRNITSLKGIEKLTELKCLSAERNKLTSIDLTANTKLQKLNLYGNQITSINLLKNTELVDLTVWGNKLTNLNLSNNKKLTYVDADNNQLTNLNVVNCTELKALYATDNKLKTLNLNGNKKLTYLSVGRNPLTSIDISGATGLKEVSLFGNQLAALNVSRCAELEFLNVTDNNLTSLDITKNTKLKTVYISGNNIDTLNTANNKQLTTCDYILTPQLSYITHVQSYGWESGARSAGDVSGTSGKSKRLEGIKLQLSTPYSTDKLGIQYRTHIQTYGWEPVWRKNGEMSGTSGQSKRLEAIEIELTGEYSKYFDVYYRVHAQTYGWLGWAKNGERSGTANQSKRLEAIQIVVVPKNISPDKYIMESGKTSISSLPYCYVELAKSAQNTSNKGVVNYRTHVQAYGNQSYVSDGSIAGTSGEGKRLEAIYININPSKLGYTADQLTSGDYSIYYRTHIQTYGWETAWKKDGQMSGTAGESKRLEAIQIKLGSALSPYYDVYYRVHAQTFGWLGWAKNGESAGTAGYGKRLEAIQIVIVPKKIVAGANGSYTTASTPPGSTARAFVSR